eukprot:g12154.t1
MAVLSTLRSNPLDDVRLLDQLPESEQVERETARLTAIAREWTRKRNLLHENWDDAYHQFSRNKMLAKHLLPKGAEPPPGRTFIHHAEALNRHYVNYDAEYGTRELSACFMHQIADAMNYLEPEIRESVYGPDGLVNLGLDVEGPVHYFGAWKDSAKPLSKDEKARLWSVQNDLQCRIAKVNQEAKWRMTPYGFEDQQTMARCYKEVCALFDGPHAVRMEKSDIPNGTWVCPFFGLGQKLDADTGLWRKVRPIANERIRNDECSPISEHLSLPGTDVLADMIVYCANPSIAATTMQTKHDVTASIKANRKAATGERMTWRDTSTLPAAMPPYAGHSFVPCFGKLDLFQAYLQLAVRDPRRNLFQVWNPELKRYEFGRLNAASFGNVHSVFGFTGSISEFLNMLSRDILRIPATVYIDDIIYMSTECLLPVYMHAIRQMLALIGIAVAPSKCEFAAKGTSIELLGIDFLSLHDEVQVSLPEKKIEAVSSKVKEVWELANAIRGGDTSKATLDSAHDILEELNGLFIHCTFWRRVKRGLPLTRHIYQLLSTRGHFERTIKANTCTAMLKVLTKRMKKEVEARVPMRIRRDTAARGRIHLMTDAAANDTDAALGGVLFHPNGTSEGFSLHLKQREIPLPLRRAKIMTFELVAVLMGKKLFRQQLQQQNATVHCDNAPAVCGIIKGQLLRKLSTAVVAAICSHNMEADYIPFYAYINTHANVADAATRTKMLSALADSCNTSFPFTKQQLLDALNEIADEVVENTTDLLL